ncbi:MAG: MFS transporter [Thermoleophilia bacterium]|jgi:MFS family permease
MLPGALGRAFRSLAIRNYRLFWFGQLVSLAGTWMQDVALSWLVLSLTDSPVALGLTMTIRFLPALLLSAYGGILADRLPKRETLIAAQCLQMLIALSMAVLTSTGIVTVLLIYVLAGIRGLVDAVEGPTRQAFVPEMVGTADVPNAVALNSTLFNAARVAGPALGAIVISNLGIAACFYINAVSFLAVIGALAAIRPQELRMVGGAPKDAVGAGLRSGFRYARSTPEIMIIFIIVGAIGTFGYNFQTLLPLVARYLLHSGASTLAVLMTAMGSGSVLAGLIAAYRGRPGRRFLFAASACFVVLLFSIGLSSSVAMTGALLFLAGVAGVLFMTAANTRIQLTVPNHLRGRVMGIYYMLFVGTTPIGSYVTGNLAEYGGVRMTVFILALLCAVGVVAAGIYAMRSRSLGRGTARPLFVRPGDGKGRSSVPHYGDRVEDGVQPE